MTMRTKTLAALGAFALAISACGGGDSTEAGDDGSDRQAVIDWLLAQDETQESAECFADELSNYTAADFEAFDAAESEEDISVEMAEDVLAAAQKCVDF